MARRILSAALTVASVAAGLTAITGSPAQAVHASTAPQVMRAYTDVRSPRELFANRPGAMPVGVWRDEQGQIHSSRSYFTYDISGYRGKLLKDAGFYSVETAVTDCTKPVVVELWLTDDLTGSSSWLNPPAQRQLILASNRGAPGLCPWGFEAHLTEIVRQALAAGRDRITLSLRVDGLKEFDPRLGRWFRSDSYLSIDANTRPTTPVQLTPCDTAISSRDLLLQARSEDPDDGDRLQATAAIWPENDPAQRRELTFGHETFEGIIEVDWRDHGLPDGRYTWSIMSSDREDASDWSAPCTFTLDRVAPAAPSVSSSDYPADGQPHGGTGVPGKFTLTGPPDAVAYRYVWLSGRGEVRATAPGEPVTVDIAPFSPFDRVDVTALDAAGNVSAATRYEFRVRDTAPWVEVGPVRGVGYPVQLTLSSPRLEGITEYRVSVLDGPETVVPAGPGGTATTTVTFPVPGSSVFHVRSFTASGLGGIRDEYVSFLDQPEIAWDGAALQFRPHRAATTHYLYSLNGADLIRVDADSTGAATVPLDVPDGWYNVDVISVDADGTLSQMATTQFAVRLHTPGPAISSDIYGPQPAGGVGTPGTFFFTTGLELEIEGFLVVLNDGPETFVWADFDGSGQIALTPDHPGTNTLTVRARYYDGAVSQPATFSFEVA